MNNDIFDLSDLGIAVKVTKPSTPDNKFSTLLYGRMKTGKSTLAASAALVDSMSPVLWIAAEDGTASFGDTYGDKIDVLRPTGAQQVLDLIYKMTEKDDEGNLKFPTKYKTVVLDTIGAYQELVKHDYIEARKSMDFEGWAKVADFPTAIVRELHDSPYNSIFIAHHEKIKDEVSGQMLIMPLMLGKKAVGDIPPIVDNVFYLGKVDTEDGTVRVLQTQGTQRIDAGGRFESKLEAQIPDPTFTKIFEAISA